MKFIKVGKLTKRIYFLRDGRQYAIFLLTGRYQSAPLLSLVVDSSACIFNQLKIGRV